MLVHNDAFRSQFPGAVANQSSLYRKSYTGNALRATLGRVGNNAVTYS